MSDEIVYRAGLPTSLRDIAAALGSIEGVTAAEARGFRGEEGYRIVGVLTVNDEIALTPSDVMAEVRKNFPQTHWPDQVLLSYQRGLGKAERRAA